MFISIFQSVVDFCEITEVTRLEGEATANNRKAKLIFFYEWDIRADWSGKCRIIFVRVTVSKKNIKGEHYLFLVAHHIIKEN